MTLELVSGGRRVDQIVFAWSDRLLIGGSGLGPVATSLDREGLRLWNERLVGGDAAVGQWHHGAAECVALGALRLGRRGDQGAVLRLLPARDANGRVSQLVHALVGPATALDARLALGLHAWPGWITPDRVPELPESLRHLDAGDLRGIADDALDALPVRHDALAGLLADVLAAPTERYLAAVAPEDLGLVAGLVRRLDGAAGDAPWTMMLGAVVPRSELGPRLLVLDLDDARRGRVPLTVGPTGDARLDRTAAMLATLSVTSLNPPRSPLTSRAALLDWAVAEHQRATKVLDLIDRALAGTLDDDARLHLDGPSGRDRLRVELRHVGTSELGERLRRWAAKPPPGLENCGRTLRVIAAERYLAEAGATRDAPEWLADATRRMGITAGEASRVLADWFGGLANVTPRHRYAVVYSGLWFGVDVTADPTVGEALRGMAPDDVLRWAAQFAVDGRTDAALHFMRSAHDRWRRSRGQAGDEQVRALLVETGTFHETIHRLVAARDATAEEETDLYRIVLQLAYGAPIDDLRPVLNALPKDAAASEFRPWTALAAIVGRRDLVFQVAAHACTRGAPQQIAAELLDRFSSADLIAGLAARPGRPDLLVTVRDLLASRRHGVDERPANRDALLANRFLIDMIESVWSIDPARRLTTYGILVRAAYRVGDRATEDGAGLSVPEVEELLGVAGPPLFRLVVLEAAGEDAVLPVLLAETRAQAAGLGLPDDLAARIVRGPHHRPAEIEYVEVPGPTPGTSDLESVPPDHGPERTPPSFGRSADTEGGEHPDGRERRERRGPAHRQPAQDDWRTLLTSVRFVSRGALVSWAIIGLALALLFSYLIFGLGSDDDPPARVTPTVTVTVTPPKAAPKKQTPSTTSPTKPTGPQD